MATVPLATRSPEVPPESLEAKFRRLATAWERAVAYHSSSTIRENHPAYLEIVALGEPVIPLLLSDMEENETHWFAALHRITGADPVQDADAGNFPRMIAAWLRWAKDRGYQW